MDKRGFVFIETIVAVVILTSSLLMLYSSFTSILQSEKTRINYDDVSYIYRSYYIKTTLNNLNMIGVLKELNNDEDKFYTTIGLEYDDLFIGYDKIKIYLSKVIEAFDVSQMVVIKENKIDELKKCTLEKSLDSNNPDFSHCNELYTNLSEEFINYIKTIYIDVSCTYILAVEYNTCQSDNTNCKNYYSWVSV